MVDPKARRRHAREDPNPWSAIAMGSLGLELAPLGPLCQAGWLPLVKRLRVLADAMRGDDGATERDVDQLRRWATAWAALNQKIRDFYVAEVADIEATTVHSNLDRVAITSALYRVLNSAPPLSGWKHGRLRRLWTDRYGTNAIYDLTPLPT